MDKFIENIVSVYGSDGQKWLDELPSVSAKLAIKYGLDSLVPVRNMSFNYVASGYQNSLPIILKLGLNSKALAKEAYCLKLFSNHAAAEILANDKNMIIMERAVPGTTLNEYFPSQDIEATNILCKVIKKLHSADIPKVHNFYNVKDLLETLDEQLDIPMNILSKARKLRDDLLSSTYKEVLLHGDLHHDNILQNRDDWLAIDPKGFIGNPAFETAAFLCNPIPELLQKKSVKQIAFERIKVCTKVLDIPEQRIYDWLYVKAVLCWAWSLEDNLYAGFWVNFLNKIYE